MRNIAIAILVSGLAACGTDPDAASGGNADMDIKARCTMPNNARISIQASFDVQLPAPGDSFVAAVNIPGEHSFPEELDERVGIDCGVWDKIDLAGCSRPQNSIDGQTIAYAYEVNIDPAIFNGGTSLTVIVGGTAVTSSLSRWDTDRAQLSCMP